MKGSQKARRQILVLATHNEGKKREFLELLGTHNENFTLRTLSDLPVAMDIEETGSTFYENARLKATLLSQRTGLWTLADDSGLEVEALQGAPGIYSARYAGEPSSAEKNNQKLLYALKDLPWVKRKAQFRCVLYLCTGGSTDLWTDTVCKGFIGFSERGTRGFGYDPLFLPSEQEFEGVLDDPTPYLGKTFAEIPPSIKNLISHRSKGVREFLVKLLCSFGFG